MLSGNGEAMPSANGLDVRLALCCGAHSESRPVVMRGREGDLQKKKGSGWEACATIRPTVLGWLTRRVKVGQECDRRVEGELKVAQATDLSRKRRAPQ